MSTRTVQIHHVFTSRKEGGKMKFRHVEGRMGGASVRELKRFLGDREKLVQGDGEV